MIQTRYASTVIIARESGLAPQDFQIYLMKRPTTMRNFHSYSVFPGGCLEEEDQWAKWEDHFINQINPYSFLPENLSLPTRPPDLLTGNRVADLPFVVAAIREVFEETGILLCQPNDQGSLVKDVIPYRQALLNKEITFWEVVQKLDLYFHTEKLTYIGRRITPPPTSIFFDANFYLTLVPSNTSSSPSSEAESDQWIQPGAALKQVEQNKITCAPATIECLNILQHLDRSIESL